MHLHRSDFIAFGEHCSSRRTHTCITRIVLITTYFTFAGLSHVIYFHDPKAMRARVNKLFLLVLLFKSVAL
jgi:hypothetical protein